MKILYLGYFSTPEVFRKIDEAGLEPSVGRQRYETALLDALLSGKVIESNDFSVISYLPKNEAIKETPETDYYLGKIIHYVWTERNNPIHIFEAINSISMLAMEWAAKTENEERIILTYAANPILLAGLSRLRPNVKIVTICSEVPEFRNMTEGNPLYNRIKKLVFSYYNEKMDGYVFMSKYMDDVCNKRNKPWIVVEGMAGILPIRRTSVKKNINGKVLFYAGGLHIENGIVILLDAMKYLEDVELQLCGVGNAIEMIRECESQFKNVHYLGSLPNETILELEKKADLLINPRKSDFQLTRYSFPSKTFEYFSSGTPCIMSKLDGIPDEYYEHCYICDVSNPETLARDIRKALEAPFEEREAKAVSAYEFIRNEKSPLSQTKKIVDFLYGLAR